MKVTTRRSLLWPAIWSALGLLLLLWLGTWQVQRLHWKEGLIAERNAALAAAPVSLPQPLDGARALEFHPVRAEGEFLNEHELYLNAQAFTGDPGFHIVTPFRLAGGATVFVDRGFVPTDSRAPATRAAGEIAGPTAVTGLLAPARAAGLVHARQRAREEFLVLDRSAGDGAGGRCR